MHKLNLMYISRHLHRYYLRQGIAFVFILKSFGTLETLGDVNKVKDMLTLRKNQFLILIKVNLNCIFLEYEHILHFIIHCYDGSKSHFDDTRNGCIKVSHGRLLPKAVFNRNVCSSFKKYLSRPLPDKIAQLTFRAAWCPFWWQFWVLTSSSFAIWVTMPRPTGDITVVNMQSWYWNNHRVNFFELINRYSRWEWGRLFDISTNGFQ